MSVWPHPVTAELTGLTPPATFARLPDALAALRESMRLLPLDAYTADCFHYYLTRPEAAQHVTRALVRDGDLVLPFTLADSAHLLRLSTGGAHSVSDGSGSASVPERSASASP